MMEEFQKLVDMYNDDFTDGSIKSYADHIISEIKLLNYSGKNETIKYLKEFKSAKDKNIKKSALTKAVNSFVSR